LAIFLFIYFSNITFLIYGTMFSIFPFRHTEPEGKPAAAVGMFFIDKLFTKVVHTLSVVMLEPTIKDISLLITLQHPPKIPPKQQDAIF
jgi:hypothetical protein